MEELANRPKSGRPRKADPNYVALLEETLEQDPQELGYGFTVWTADRLRFHLQTQTGKLLGATQFRALLKEHGFVYRRPKHDLTDLQDPQARAAAEAWLEEQKKCRSRRDRPFLCGRKHLRLAAGVGGLLDETGLSKTHSHPRTTTMAAYLWGLQLGHR